MRSSEEIKLNKSVIWSERGIDMSYNHALYTLNKEKKRLEDKIEDIKDHVLYPTNTQRMRSSMIRMFEEQLQSVSDGIKKLGESECIQK